MSPEQKIALEVLAMAARTNQAIIDLTRQLVTGPPAYSDSEEAALASIPFEPDRITGPELLSRVCLTLGEEISERTLARWLQRFKGGGLITSSDRKPFGYSRVKTD